jgi:hypothetical protein
MSDADPRSSFWTTATPIETGAITTGRIGDDPETLARMQQWAKDAQPLIEWSDREQARRAALPWWRRKLEDWGLVRSGAEMPPRV